MLWAPGLWMVFYMIGRDIIPVKLTWTILYSELKTCMLPPLEGNNKGCKMNDHNDLIKI